MSDEYPQGLPNEGQPDPAAANGGAHAAEHSPASPDGARPTDAGPRQEPGINPAWQPPAVASPAQPGSSPGGAQRAPLPPAPAPWTAPAPAQNRSGWFRKGFGLGAGGALGAGSVLLGLSLVGSILSGLVLAGIGSAMGNTASADTTAYETVWGDDGAKNTLRAIDVRGSIMAGGDQGMGLTQATYGYEVADMIDQITKDEVDGLVLRMDTPGGTINGSRAIGEAIIRYRERTGHKVLAVVEGMSASGGMFAMAPADKIVADHGTLIGSIGVISGPFEQYKDVKAVDGGLLAGGVTTTGGITSEYITQGKGKDFGNPWRAMTAEERKVWADGLAAEYAGFTNWVSQHRKIPEATIRNDLGAHIFDPETAKAKKLVDDVMGRDEAYQEAARLNGLDPKDTRLEAASAPSFMRTLLGAESRIYGQAPAATAQEGQPPQVTSALCTGRPQVLVWNGPTRQFCGR
ncbi:MULTISPECIES: S49 family peptidase [unclassified Luteococcus]|uniref:S49 family peptidase n=1 Tax=unclassified Luteococcus TaxID=2639923 RepID=UPI00313BF826